ncbi:MAG: cytochrome c oxidase subunit 3 [Flavobacteriia bacterium]|nr:cytochrome c oxidase subunit 3 [Flavobacteriia bacterium]OJX35947.1 MAG: hypothetical protein BGO87_05615 [Flavobacteriia bacterium 40-80]
MGKDYNVDISFETREKMKKNLVYIGIFSIVMIFAGLTSAYIVSMGGAFWVKFPFPSSFYFSTASIVLSSVTYILAINATKKDEIKKTRVFMILTLLLGIAFSLFQFNGYKQLYSKGAFLVSPITVVDGRYGDYYEVKQNGHFVEVDGNNYLLQGKRMTASEMQKLQNYFRNFEKITTSRDSDPVFNNLDSDIILYYKNEPLQLIDGHFVKPDGTRLLTVDLQRLQMLSWNIRDGRGDFFHKGEYGKDFKLYFKGKELQYKDRSLYYQGKKLNVPLQNKLSQSRDNATSYLYVITGLHLLHILVTLLYLLRMVFVSFSDDFNENKKLSIKLGGIFWHFLGLLWLYLLLFLLFIH